MKRKIFLFLILISFLIYFSSCSSSNNTFTVAFNSNGGSFIESVDVEKGESILEPLRPEKAGYIFLGWYSDSTLNSVYNFSYPVNGNLNLHAKWEETLQRKRGFVALSLIASGWTCNGSWRVVDYCSYENSSDDGVLTMEFNFITGVMSQQFYYKGDEDYASIRSVTINLSDGEVFGAYSTSISGEIKSYQTTGNVFDGIYDCNDSDSWKCVNEYEINQVFDYIVDKFKSAGYDYKDFY